MKEESNDDFVNEPTVFIEILSPSTKEFELGEKFRLYENIPTLKEYVFINSENLHIKVSRLVGEHWELQEYTNIDKEIGIKCLELLLTI